METSQWSREELMTFLEQYIKSGVRTSEEFSSASSGTGVWVSGEDESDYEGRVIYDYYAEGPGYELGVLSEFEDILQQHGWYSEWYDAGTVMIYPI
jgi:hypothetical protein